MLVEASTTFPSLRFAVLPSRPSVPDFGFQISNDDIRLMNLAYEAWSTNWKKTFNELNSHSTPQPNEFLRQVAWGVLLLNGEIVAMESLCYFDLRLRVNREHSYVKRWPVEFIESVLKSDVQGVMSIEYLHADYSQRRLLRGVKLSELVTCLCVRLFLASPVKFLLGVSRNDKRTNSFMYERGAYPLVKNFPIHNVTGDLVCVDRDRFTIFNGSPLDMLADQLWNERQDFLSKMNKQTTERKAEIPMNPMKELEKFCDECLSPVIEEARSFPWTDSSSYSAYLSQTYYYLIHSTRLLALAASRFNTTQQHLHLRCIEHMREEKNHEILALQDLKELGHVAEEYRELPPTSLLYQSQYYLIEHVSPSALFGYILCLEGLAARIGKEVYDTVVKTYPGIKVDRFLRVHALEDEGHVAKALDQVSKMRREELDLIRRSLKISCFNFKAMIVAVKNGEAAIDTHEYEQRIAV